MADINRALSSVLDEILEGAAKDFCWILNPSDQGLLRSLDQLSASAASAVPASGGASIAAHVDHLRYGLSLLNRWAGGDEGAFAETDYAASWRRLTVSDAEWKQLRDQLRAEAHAWQTVVRTPREMSDFELTGVVASVAHLAYHLGAMRQIDRSVRGPAASD